LFATAICRSVVMTGFGPVAVRQPGVWDRKAAGRDPGWIFRAVSDEQLSSDRSW
jgi:hypothetical protein